MDEQKKEQKSMGRGSLLLQAMKQQKQQQEQQQKQDVTPSGSSQPSIGRGSLLSMLKATRESEVTGLRREEPSKSIPQGRASLLNLVKKTQAKKEPQEESENASRVTEFTIGKKFSDLSIQQPTTSSSASLYEGSEIISRKGEAGTIVSMTANYIDLKQDPEKGRFMYDVKYNPEVDSISLRRKLIYQHSAAFGRNLIFDGTLLYLPQKLPQDRTVYKSDHPSDGSPVTLTFIFIRKASYKENVYFFNVLLKRIMRALELVKIGQQSFNPKKAHHIVEYSLEVWPGYVTAINEHEGGLKLCIDGKHRVMWKRTVHNLMEEIAAKNKHNFREVIMNELLGTTVMTRYNNKTYRVDDIDWTKNPTLTFTMRDKRETSLIDYYKNHWNLTIKNLGQPLIVHRSKERLPTGEVRENCILLVPELCYISGLTDNMRSDYKTMRALDSVTRMSPRERHDVIRKFIQEIQNNEVTREILAQWGLELDTTTTKLTGRILAPEQLHFKKDFITVNANVDWGGEATKRSMWCTPDLTHWYIIYTQRDARIVSDFIGMLCSSASKMGMKINDPNPLILRDDRTESYVKELQRNLNKNIEMVVIIFPTNRSDRYAAVKKLCCVEKPIPSQVVMSRTISRGDKLRSVSQKIALQMNCKLGGALWAIKIPLEKTMICGIDVYHPGVGQRVRGSVAGFVASMNKSYTTWYSKICIQGPRQELIDLLQVCFISAINSYKKINGYWPDRIIMYRDGVSDSQIEIVGNYEIKQFQLAFTSIDPSYQPKLSVVIVQKRINTRIFSKRGDNLENPPPGTVVDTCITRKNYYDFFLVSQNVRQGTVTPTHYIVAFDTLNLSVDQMQRLTYKLCHLYYNWCGTIRVPAPCQYAHKLAYLVGQSIQMEPDSSLNTRLYYL